MKRTEIESDDKHGAKMGMWLFIYGELMFFVAMFLLYAAYRHLYSDDFIKASMELNTVMGTINTVILLTSSLTMVLSINSIKDGNRRLSIAYLSTTIFLGVVFLVNKYMEWGAKIHHGIYPNSEELLKHNKGEILFYGLYYLMTGMHILHIIIGIIILSVMLVSLYKRKISKDENIYLENSGLFWHLVDIIWIFLFPLFYLI